MASQSGSAQRPRIMGGHGGGRPTGEKAKDRRGVLRRLSPITSNLTICA